MKKLSLLPIICTSVLMLLSACDTQPDRLPPDLIFTNAYVVDGTGEPGQVADVRVRGDRILKVGSLTPTDAETEIDATNLVLAPGFIDTHSHHDGGLEEGGALAAVSQGITTIIAGQDGGSPLPLADFFTRMETATVSVNVAAYVGHNSIRRRVMGDDFRREATLEEIEEMKVLLESELESGALGLSTGLEYDPGIYSSTDEVVELARSAASVGGRYISHMRSEDREFFSALEELLHIGRETGIPVQVSHMKLAMKSLWGETGRVLSMLDAAREEGINVTADVYPYEFWQSTMTVLFPGREFTREAATFALEELAPPEGMFIAAFGADPSYVGMSLAEIAEVRGKDAVTVYLELIAEAEASDGRESIIARSMTETDIAELLSWPYTNVSSDGGLNGRHPRGYGSFTRVLGRHVRERGELLLESAIRKMSSLAAENTGLSERGEIREGYFADLVLFDAETVLDRATPDEPNLPSVGIVGVWVNGARVYNTEGVTGNRPGRVLRRRDN